MQSEQTKGFNVAIIGGGMGGLALAVGLVRGGIKVDIYEQAVTEQHPSTVWY
jgi:salicylate hydroxylase